MADHVARQLDRNARTTARAEAPSRTTAAPPDIYANVGDPVEILQPGTRLRRKAGMGKFAFAGILFTIVGGLEVVKPLGFSPFQTLGKAVGNFQEPVREADKRAELCFLQQQSLAQRLSDAERDYADAMGSCEITSLLDLLQPGAGAQVRAICQQTVRQDYGTSLRQLRDAYARAQACQL